MKSKNGIDHEHCSGTEAAHTLEVRFKSGTTLRVTAVAVKPQVDRFGHEVTINLIGGDCARAINRAYSLYNLGIQGRSWDVIVSGFNVRHGELLKQDPKAPGGLSPIPKIGKYWTIHKTTWWWLWWYPWASRVCFINLHCFPCSLRVDSCRPRYGKTLTPMITNAELPGGKGTLSPLNTKDSHDSVPYMAAPGGMF